MTTEPRDTAPWSGRTSSFHRTVQFKSLKDVSYSPRFRPPLLPGKEAVSDRARAAKRRRVVTLAQAIVDGSVPELLSVSGNSTAVRSATEKHLKARKEPLVVKSSSRMYSSDWLDVESQDAILHRINDDRSGWFSPLDGASSLSHEGEPPRKRSSPPSQPAERLPKPDSKKQRRLTTSFKGSKVKSPPERTKHDLAVAAQPDNPHKESKPSRPPRRAQTTLEPQQAVVVDSPFLFHKRGKGARTTAKTPLQGRESGERTITARQQTNDDKLNGKATEGAAPKSRSTIMPGSKNADEKRTFPLRPSQVHRQMSGKRLPAAHLAYVASTKMAKHDTQAMIDDAQDALCSSQSLMSSPSAGRSVQIAPSEAQKQDKTGSTEAQHADAQAIFLDRTPCSSAAHDVHTLVKSSFMLEPTFEDSGLMDSFVDWNRDNDDIMRVKDSFPPMASCRSQQDRSSYQAAQLGSQSRAREENEIDMDITNIAQGLIS